MLLHLSMYSFEQQHVAQTRFTLSEQWSVLCQQVACATPAALLVDAAICTMIDAWPHPMIDALEIVHVQRLEVA